MLAHLASTAAQGADLIAQAVGAVALPRWR